MYVIVLICYIPETTLKFVLSFNKKIYSIFNKEWYFVQEISNLLIQSCCVSRTLRCRAEMADKSVDEEGDGGEGDHRQIRP